ncbi:MAG: carboxylating nicotinate-nucleotide diphosphorylase [Erysipelotrichaceae bacterium]
MMLNKFYIDDFIKDAIKEDINYIDVAADYLIAANHTSDAYMIAKEEGILAGLDIAIRVFELMDPSFTIKSRMSDGDHIKVGDIIMRFAGTTVSLLKSERVALNILQSLSGTASETARCVELVKGTKASIVDTRKTIPGMRPLQKYAVCVGGGKNHRYNLSSAAMLKDNHIDAAGSITKAITELRKHMGFLVCIEVETRNLEEVKEALEAKADYIMLDNMDNEMMKEAVRINNGQAVLEASGGITSKTLRGIAETGVDIISIGALTHSVKAFDISMKFNK